MKLSDLGLTPDEVNSIMADVAGGGQTVTAQREPEAPKAVPAPQQQQAVIRVNEATPAIDNTKTQDVGESLIPGKGVVPPSGQRVQPTTSRAVLPSAVVPPGMATPKPPEKKSGAGLILAAAGAGFLVGGPAGAAVGAGAAWLLGKGAAPAPVPVTQAQPGVQPGKTVTQAAPAQAIVQVTPTSSSASATPKTQTRALDAGIKTLPSTRLAPSVLSSRAGLVAK